MPALQQDLQDIRLILRARLRLRMLPDSVMRIIWMSSMSMMTANMSTLRKKTISRNNPGESDRQRKDSFRGLVEVI